MWRTVAENEKRLCRSISKQARQDSRKEASNAISDADTLTIELLIDRVLVYPDKRIEIVYKI